MRLSQLFTKTSKTVSQETESINARLLTQAGFIYQELAGVYSFLPLGLKVLNKIEAIVRRHIDTVASEILMPTLSSTSSWQKTERLESVDVLLKAVGANQLSAKRNRAEYILGPSHEEVITPLAKHYRTSYRDFPFAIYQIQSKFRNEPRAKSGLLRGREFRMKDMYSFHTSQADLAAFYGACQTLYMKIFADLDLASDTYLTVAGGGDFSENYSHEFQTLLASGEDEIYLDQDKRLGYNKEIATNKDSAKLGVKFDSFELVRASEIGNIYLLDHKYSKAFNYYYVDQKNQKKLVYMGCYGIGTSRLMGVIAEKFADDKGLVWPAAVAPAKAHLLSISESKKVKTAADQLYQELTSHGIEVVYDDRNESPGAKLSDADLLGIPTRVVVSEKTLAQKSAEVKSRISDQAKLVKLAELMQYVAG